MVRLLQLSIFLVRLLLLNLTVFLGYGATTFPSLTEAITFERNSTLAQDEVTRLQVLIDSIVKTIKLKESCV